MLKLFDFFPVFISGCHGLVLMNRSTRLRNFMKTRVGAVFETCSMGSPPWVRVNLYITLSMTGSDYFHSVDIFLHVNVCGMLIS